MRVTGDIEHLHLTKVVSHVPKFGDASTFPAGGTVSPNFEIYDTAV